MYEERSGMKGRHLLLYLMTGIILLLYYTVNGLESEAVTADSSRSIKIQKTSKIETLREIKVKDSKAIQSINKAIMPGILMSIAPEKSEVTILSVGDDLFHKKVIDSGRALDGSYQYHHIFSNITTYMKQVDLAVINQETILSDGKKGYFGYPRFATPESLADAIDQAGFDIVLHATNHVLDQGKEMILYTLKQWKQHSNIHVLGIHETKESSDQITIITKNKIRIAVLNYTYGMNGNQLKSSDAYMVDMLREKEVLEDIKKAKKAADFIIVFPHWGTEYQYSPNKYQRQWAQFFCEQGVDLVIGTHPHVLQSVEWIKSNDHRMLVYYSLGNFVSTMDYTDRMLGGMAKVTICKENGKTRIKSADMIPIVTHYERGKDSHLTVYPLSVYSEKLASRHYILKDRRGKDFSIPKLKELYDHIISSDVIPYKEEMLP